MWKKEVAERWEVVVVKVKSGRLQMPQWGYAVFGDLISGFTFFLLLSLDIKQAFVLPLDHFLSFDYPTEKKGEYHRWLIQSIDATIEIAKTGDGWFNEKVKNSQN